MDSRTGRPARLWRAAFGPLPFARQVQVHALHSAAEACFAVSLAGSLFFNVSVDAARPRIMLYLALTMAPFAIVAPALGPLIDRFRGGHRFVLIVTCAGGALVALALARDLQRLLFYPEAFAVLVLGKAYSIAKNALVPGLVADPDALVDSNARLSRLGTVAGAAGGVLAAALLGAVGAPWALRLGAVAYAGAAVVALRLPRPKRPPVVSAALEYEELHTPPLRLSPWAMAALRGSVGFLVFHLGFVLKRSGDPAWVFGAVLAVGGLGGFAGTFIAPRVRRTLSEDRILVLSLVVPSGAAAVAAWQQGRLGMLMVAAALGVAANTGRQAFDSLVQRDAAYADRGRAFARFETGFQLAWVAGALLAVGARPPGWAGMLGLAVILGGASAWFRGSLRAIARARRPSPGPDSLVAELCAAADHALAVGAFRRAVVLAATAARTSAEQAQESEPGPVESRDELESLRQRAVRGEQPMGEEHARRAVQLAKRLVPPPPSPSVSDQVGA